MSDSEYKHHEDEVIQLQDLWLVLRKNWILVIVTAVIGLVAGTIWLMNQPQRYQAQAVIQVKNSNSALGGLSGALGSLSDMTGMGQLSNDSDNLSNQKALLTSGVVLFPAIKKTQYNVNVKPFYFPVIGFWWANNYHEDQVAPSVLGLDRYAWGGQKLQIKDFRADALPVHIVLKAQSKQQYKLYDTDDNLLGKGQVGDKLTLDNLGKNHLIFQVSDMRAKAGNHFSIKKNTLLATMHAVQSSLDVTQMGDKTNLLNISLKTTRPQKAKQLLNAIIDIGQHQNEQRKSRQAQQTLDFLKKQIPIAKKAFRQAQNRLLHYESKNGAVDLDRQTQLLMKRLSSYEESINQLQLQKLAAKKLYTKKHPYINSLNEKLHHLKQKEKQLQDKVKQLPEDDQKAFMLKKDMEVKSQLYSALLQRKQKLRVMKAGTLSDLLTLEKVQVEKAYGPISSSLMMVLALILGGGLGFFIAVLKEFLRERGLRDLHLVDDILGVDHKAVVPLSKRQKQIDKNRRKSLLTQPVLLAKNHPNDGAVEGLRSLKTNIMMKTLKKQKTSSNCQGSVICLHSITPASGKSFIAGNLCYLLTQAQHRVILLDVDLRRSRVSEVLQLDKNKPGLLAYLDNEVNLEDCIQNWQGDFDVLPGGGGAHETTNYLESDKFASLMQTLRQRYDFVVLDAAPILGVSDGLVINRFADHNLVIIDALDDNIKELRYGFSIYRKNNCSIDGSIVNKLDPRQQAGSGINYHYYYKYSANSDKSNGKD